MEFSVATDYGTLRLSGSNELDFELECTNNGKILTSEDIQKLYQDMYRKLRDSEIITGGKAWYLVKRMYHEI